MLPTKPDVFFQAVALVWPSSKPNSAASAAHRRGETSLHSPPLLLGCGTLSVTHCPPKLFSKVSFSSIIPLDIWAELSPPWFEWSNGSFHLKMSFVCLFSVCLCTCFQSRHVRLVVFRWEVGSGPCWVSLKTHQVGSHVIWTHRRDRKVLLVFASDFLPSKTPPPKKEQKKLKNQFRPAKLQSQWSCWLYKRSSWCKNSYFQASCSRRRSCFPRLTENSLAVWVFQPTSSKSCFSVSLEGRSDFRAQMSVRAGANLKNLKGFFRRLKKKNNIVW